MREKVGKSRFTMFFQWFVAPEGRKVGSLKRRVRSQLARWEMKNCTPLWREAHFQVKMYKTHHSRTTFGSCDVEKVHAVVARSTFPSRNVQNTPASDHFWKLRCRKSARRCGVKHIFKSKCTKHIMVGPLLEVAMSKKCTPLWREAHFQVEMYKTPQRRTTFGSWDVKKVHAVVARSTFSGQNVQNTSWWDHFWKLRCRKSARRCGAKHISKSKCTKHTILGPLLEVQISKKCTPLWREAHLEVKMVRTLGVRTPILEVQISRKCTPLWREAHLEVKMLRTLGVRTTILEVQISKKCTPLWREAHLEVKMLKTLGVRTIFGSSDLEKVHAVVVRSTFGSQTVKNTRGR